MYRGFSKDVVVHHSLLWSPRQVINELQAKDV